MVLLWRFNIAMAIKLLCKLQSTWSSFSNSKTWVAWHIRIHITLERLLSCGCGCDAPGLPHAELHRTREHLTPVISLTSHRFVLSSVVGASWFFCLSFWSLLWWSLSTGIISIEVPIHTSAFAHHSLGPSFLPWVPGVPGSTSWSPRRACAIGKLLLFLPIPGHCQVFLSNCGLSAMFSASSFWTSK